MTNDPLYEHVVGMVAFLRRYGAVEWASILEDIVSSQGRTKEEMRHDLRKLFGGMGSLTDLNLRVDVDPKKTNEINAELSRQTEMLFHLVD